MLPRIHRLPLRFERNRLQKMGTAFHSSNLTAIIAPQEITGPTRFAIILSKKISNKAVVRNKLRRHVLNSLQPHLSQLNPGFDILLLAKKSLLQATITQIQSDLKIILTNANLVTSS